jgi:hypothetical protein
MLASSILTLVVIPLMYYGDQVRHVKPHPDLSKPPSFSQEALN